MLRSYTPTETSVPGRFDLLIKVRRLGSPFATSHSGLGTPVSRLHRGFSSRKSAPGMGSPLSQDWATSALELGSPLPATFALGLGPHVCTATGLAASASAPNPGLTLPHLRRDFLPTLAPGICASSYYAGCGCVGRWLCVARHAPVGCQVYPGGQMGGHLESLAVGDHILVRGPRSPLRDCVLTRYRL